MVIKEDYSVENAWFQMLEDNLIVIYSTRIQINTYASMVIWYWIISLLSHSWISRLI